MDVAYNNSDLSNDNLCGRPLELEWKVRHHRQQYNWDCGLSCIQMILKDNDYQNFRNNFNSICKAEGFNKSTWTIDLCYLLKKFCIPHEFYTLTLGVHYGYRHASFYEKVFTKDEHRVNRRFRKSSSMGIKVFQDSLPLEAILERLQDGPAIVLTNSKLLTCAICKHNKIKTEIRKCFPILPSYEGHYIVLSGYNIQLQVVYYRNPAFFDHQCAMSFSVFEDARKAFGTDEDIIFIQHSTVEIKPRTQYLHSSH